MACHAHHACRRGLRCPRANAPKVCQLLIFTCQHAKSVPIIQLSMPKGEPIFQHLQISIRKFENRRNNICLIPLLDARSFSRWCTFLKLFEIPA